MNNIKHEKSIIRKKQKIIRDKIIDVPTTRDILEIFIGTFW